MCGSSWVNTVLEVGGGVAGYVYGGPWGAAAGAAGGAALAGQDKHEIMTAAALGGAGGYGASTGLFGDTVASAAFSGIPTQAAAPIADASFSTAGLTAAGSDAGMLGATSATTGGITAGGTAAGTAAGATAGGTTAAAAPWYKNFSNILALGSSVYGIMTAQQIKEMAAKAAAQQDPFAKQRAGYATQLAALDANPSSVTSLPGYKFGLEQGEQAISRRAAASGFSGSGNEAIALKQYDQMYAGQYLSSEQQRLAQLAGAQFAPTGGNTQLTGELGSADIMNRALASTGYVFGGRSPGVSAGGLNITAA